jgi:diamine N-acetyltransferase
MDRAITIRPAVLADYDGLCALWTVLDELHRIALPHMFRVPVGPRRQVGYVRSLIDGPDSTLLVAEAGDGALLGFLTVILRVAPAMSIRPERRYGEIDNLVVEPSHRRTGIGRSLMEAAERWAESRGLNSLDLGVHAFNREALAFYQSVGFSTRLRLLSRPVRSAK